MNDAVSPAAGDSSIPPALGWEILQKLVDADKLLKTGGSMGDVRDPARRILNDAATALTRALMPGPAAARRRGGGAGSRDGLFREGRR